MKPTGYDFKSDHPNAMNPPGFLGNARASRLFLASVFAVLLFPMRLHAAVIPVYWDIQEIYTNADGSVQFIELFTPYNAYATAGQTITVSNGVTSHVYVFPTDTPTNVANHTILIGTSTVPIYGGPQPDFFFPGNFLFPNTTSISFDGTFQGTVTIPFLPTDGTQSLAITTTPQGTGSGGVTSIQALNSPRNYAGATGTLLLGAATANISTVVRNGTGFVVTGRTNPGRTVSIQAAPNLVSAFSTIGTATGNISGAFSFTDTSATSLQMRFYRATYP